MAARLAGLGVVVVLGAATGLDAEPAAVAYALAVMVLLWVEAWWLARTTDDGTEGGDDATRAAPADGAGPDRR